MSKALVSVYGDVKSATFRTSWSSFQKNNMKMNLLVMPHEFTIDNGVHKLTCKPQMPKEICDSRESTDKIYMVAYLKDDLGVFQCNVGEITVADLATEVTIGDLKWMRKNTTLTFEIDDTNLTLDKHYDVVFGFSDLEIGKETVVTPGDFPFVGYGKVSLATFDLINTEI